MIHIVQFVRKGVPRWVKIEAHVYPIPAEFTLGLAEAMKQAAEKS